MAELVSVPRTGAGAAPEGRRWLALVFIAMAQLMVALDATIVSIALPSAQSALHGSDGQRQLVVTSYTLAFGGLLLLGGRVGDLLGRRRTFLAGLLGFATASAVGGLAQNLAMLLAARALQGACAALLAPTALSLVAITFTTAQERAKAFAVYGGIAGSGGAAGLLLGSVLTEYLSWRWCLYVNVPIALVAAAGASALLHDDSGGRRPHFDIPGVVLAMGSLVSLVYACTVAASDGWGNLEVTTLLAAAVVLGALFVLREQRTAQPLLPLRIVLERNRGGAYLCVACAVAAMFGVFLLLTYDFQVVLHYSPVRAGLAFLPLSGAALFSSGALGSRLLPRLAPRQLMVPGLLVACAGMLLLTQLGVDSSYWVQILPAELLIGGGMGTVFVPAFHVATQGVDRRDAGVASATVNTAQQVGGSIGTAVLNTVAAGVTGTPVTATALVHGYAAATAVGAGLLFAAAVLTGLLVDRPRPEQQTHAPALQQAS